MRFSLVLSALAGLALADLGQRDTKGTRGTKVAAGHPAEVEVDPPCCSAVGSQGVLQCDVGAWQERPSQRNGEFDAQDTAAEHTCSHTYNRKGQHRARTRRRGMCEVMSYIPTP
ncbi:hypothetical protein E4U37_001088 [Claviceps purpurea]|nr:hypothetical protein E4U37_001088 [Claviceps purpurea]